MIMKRSTGREIKLAAMKRGMRTLRMVGLDRVRDGLTTLEEVMRVTAAD
jgi:type II secretory ATPase GspE/PulE/Tfp pilus assembly ATPase PilB-like protein